MNRRDFLRRGVVAGAGLAAYPAALRAEERTIPVALQDDAATRVLAMRALDAARGAGASYADVRISRNRTQSIATRDARVMEFADDETYGLGVRVIAGGAIGFVATYQTTPAEAERAAVRAVAQARGAARTRLRPVELAPAAVTPDGRWRSPIRTDPFEVSVEEKVDLLLRANAAALGVRGTRLVNSSLAFIREEKTFASTEGTYTVQTVYRCWPQLTVTAVAAGDFQTRQSTDVAPMGLGYEYVVGADLVGNASRWAEDAVAKLSAKPVEPGRYDLVLLPSHLFLTIHESIAHPTELDRVLGYEANFAGTSFISSVDEYLGKFRYGPDIMSVQGERSTPGALASVGWDDEGVRPDEFLIVRNGILEDLQTTRDQAAMLADHYARQRRPVRSHGNSHAQSWADIQFQRMPNVNLLPHPDRDVPLEELVDGVRNGILIEGRGSYSIDQQRYNAQFGGQVFHEIKNGRIRGMLKDVAYQMRTPEFWNSMDLIGGRSSYALGGTFNDGKGQPSQANAVSHGCPPARFREATVINSGRGA